MVSKFVVTGFSVFECYLGAELLSYVVTLNSLKNRQTVSALAVISDSSQCLYLGFALHSGPRQRLIHYF